MTLIESGFNRVLEDRLDAGLCEPTDAFKGAAWNKGKKLNPAERLSFMMLSHSTRIKHQFALQEKPPVEPFYASSVIKELGERLEISLKRETSNFKRVTRLSIMISNEIKKINDCVNQGCLQQAKGILSDIDSMRKTRSLKGQVKEIVPPVMTA